MDKKKEKQELILLDSSAILNDCGFSFDPKQKYAITSRIASELKDLRSRMMIDNALMLRLLSIIDPCPLSVQRMQDFVSSKGFEKLSEADISLLSLASELKAQKQKIFLASDDYSIQNMCQAIGIPYRPAIQGNIKGTIEFEKYCPACEREYKCGYKGKNCELCSTQLKTRVKKQKTP